MKIRDLIRRSLTNIGVLAEGENPSGSQQQDAFDTLRELLASWSTEGLMIGAKSIETFDLVPGKSTYTFGPGGDFDSSRPLNIEIAKSIGLASAEVGIHIQNLDQWAHVQIKEAQSSFPTRLFGSYESPKATLHFWPVPNQATKVTLYTWKDLGSFASVNVDLEFAPGYSRAIRTNLAIELAPDYGKSVPAELVAVAEESKANIKRKNIQPVYMQVDMALRNHGFFSILTGE